MFGKLHKLKNIFSKDCEIDLLKVFIKKVHKVVTKTNLFLITIKAFKSYVLELFYKIDVVVVVRLI